MKTVNKFADDLIMKFDGFRKPDGLSHQPLNPCSERQILALDGLSVALSDQVLF